MDNMDLVIESFIGYCDDMQIADEGTQIDAFKIYISKEFKEMKNRLKKVKS